MLSDGIKILESPDDSFIEVFLTYELLPIRLNTPPAALFSKDVTISDNTVNQGIVRDIAPAHSSLDIIDVSEYGPDGRISNVKGPLTESDFVDCNLVNLTINDGAVDTNPPFKNSYLNPTLVAADTEGEVLDVALTSPHIAVLEYETDQYQPETLLFEDGIVMPNNTWQFDSSNQIQILNFSVNSQYAINYRPIYQITTPYLDLGTSFQEYAWFADYMLWNRMEHTPVSRQAEVPVYFSQDSGRAALTYPSTAEQANATLYYDDEDGRVEVPSLNWYFLSPFEIKMDASQYVKGYQFYLVHDEVRIYPKNVFNITFEHRSGIDSRRSCSRGGDGPARPGRKRFRKS